MDNEVLVIGIGNRLMKDDGVGFHVVRELEKMKLPDGVKVIDGGTGGIQLVEYMKYKNIVIVDAMEMNTRPGRTLKINPDELLSENNNGMYSLHNAGVIDTLDLANKLGFNPEVTMFGIQPKEISQGMDLTPEVNACMPEIISSLISLIQYV